MRLSYVLLCSVLLGSVLLRPVLLRSILLVKKIMSLKVLFKKVLLGILLLASYFTCAVAEQPSSDCNDQRDQACAAVSTSQHSKASRLDPIDLVKRDRLPAENTERLDTGLPVSRMSMCQLRETCYRVVDQSSNRRVVLDNVLQPIRFASGKHDIPDSYLVEIKQLLEKLSDKKGLKLTFVGHTDNEKLSPNAKRIYGDNLGLSFFRSKEVMLYIQKSLVLRDEAVSHDGKAYAEPVASNDTRQGMALNRRVEVQVSYEASDINQAKMPVDQCPVHSSGDIVVTQTPVALIKAQNIQPWRISVDGQPLQVANGLHIADIQRCNDVALENSRVQVQFDSGIAEPSLNVVAWPEVVNPGSTVNFKAWTNYPYWIERYELRIYSASAFQTQAAQVTHAEGGHNELLAVLPFNKHFESDWQVPEALDQASLSFRLRAYDKQGRYDETIAKRLNVIRSHSNNNEQHEEAVAQHVAFNAGYGVNALERQRIPVRGGTITANGLAIPQDHQVWVMDQVVPIDTQGQFVAQHILPYGFHTASVVINDKNGNGESFWRDLRIENNDWFYVGLADVTLHDTDRSGSIDLVRTEDISKRSAYGRFAYYTKGNLNSRYQLTARIDSGEEPLNRIFKNIDERDPRSLLRRLDAEDGFATFGDDSTTVDDAPTQGKFYLKVEDDHSHAMWGNFVVDIDDNELAQMHRGLYGLSGAYESTRSVGHGEAKTQIDMYAASPDTVSAHEEFRSTGGSLYYLRHRDLTLGSEQLRVETRDKDTGFVLASAPLRSGQDYDIDELQGTVLLSKPLSSYDTQLNSGALVRSSSFDGHPVYLVVDYEYQPALTDVDALNVGGRVSQWVGEHVRLGVSASHQDNDNGANQRVGAADITLLATANTWIKVSAGQSEGPGINEQTSLDGGFDFIAGSSSQRDVKADASRVELRLDGNDIGIEKPWVTTLYWQDRDAGYSGLAQQTLNNTEQLGVNTQLALSDSVQLSASHSNEDIHTQRKQTASELDIYFNLDKHWQLGLGVRDDQRTDRQSSASSTKATRTDGLLRLRYQSEKPWSVYVFGQDTLDHDSQRLDNDRYGIGGNWQLNKKLALNAEVSDGELGEGALAGLSYKRSEQTRFYLNYSLDSDEESRGQSRQSLADASKEGNIIAGTKTRFNDHVSVYAEERYAYGDQPEGLTQAYGVELAFDQYWTYGMTLEHGELASETTGTIERFAIGLQAGYVNGDTHYAGSAEHREDKSDTQTRDSWLFRNTLKYQIDDAWRFLSRLDYAFSESSEGDFFDGDFIEGVLGYAYRPVDNSRWNNLFTYTYLLDRTTAAQLDTNEQSIGFQQRSHVIALDLNYDITQRWEIGGRYAFRRSELRDRALDSGRWFRSDAALYVLRADWHLTHKWDFLIEGRLLDLKDSNDQLEGALIGLYRHFGNHFKIGAGYNFSDFSDDLTNLDYDAKGFFINAIGKF